MSPETLHFLLGLLRATRLEAADPNLEERAATVATARRELEALIKAHRDEERAADQARREAAEIEAAEAAEREQFGPIEPAPQPHVVPDREGLPEPAQYPARKA